MESSNDPTETGDDFGYRSRPELAIAALIHLMARFADSPCRGAAFSICAHLQFVASDARLPTAVRSAATEAQRLLQGRLHSSAGSQPYLDS